jgi:CRP-like cAMP-binding protein
MFVVVEGDLRVQVPGQDGAPRDRRYLRAGDFFGEMSLLTGDARSATVTAATDCELIEIGADAFRRVVLADASILDQVTAAVSTRRLELAQHRATRTMEPAVVEAPQTLVDRVRRFLRL